MSQQTYTPGEQQNYGQQTNTPQPQSYGQYQTGQKMNQPPNVITTKDLAYIQDAMSWELVAMKKCHYFARESQNQKVINQLEKAGRMHQHHYEILLRHLNTNQSNQMTY